MPGSSPPPLAQLTPTPLERLGLDMALQQGRSFLRPLPGCCRGVPFEQEAGCGAALTRDLAWVP